MQYPALVCYIFFIIVPICYVSSIVPFLVLCRLVSQIIVTIRATYPAHHHFVFIIVTMSFRITRSMLLWISFSLIKVLAFRVLVSVSTEMLFRPQFSVPLFLDVFCFFVFVQFVLCMRIDLWALAFVHLLRYYVFICVLSFP